MPTGKMSKDELRKFAQKARRQFDDTSRMSMTSTYKIDLTRLRRERRRRLVWSLAMTLVIVVCVSLSVFMLRPSYHIDGYEDCLEALPEDGETFRGVRNFLRYVDELADKRDFTALRERWAPGLPRSRVAEGESKLLSLYASGIVVFEQVAADINEVYQVRCVSLGSADRLPTFIDVAKVSIGSRVVYRLHRVY